MIVSEKEYVRVSHEIANPNDLFHYIHIPADEKIYEIDLNSKIVEAPENIGVAGSHNSEIYWFSIDRFYETRDMSTCACWIEYVNVDKESFYFSTTLKQIIDKDGNDKLLIPWLVSKEATKKAGIVQFAFHFYNTIDTIINGQITGVQYSYILNTRPANTKVLPGFNGIVSSNDAVAAFKANELKQLTETVQRLSGEYALYWDTGEI